MANNDQSNSPRTNNVSRNKVDPSDPHNSATARKTSNDRDPNAHRTDDKKSGGTKWLWIALAVILGLIILAWLFGAFDGDDDAAVMNEEPVIVEPADTAPAVEGTDADVDLVPVVPTE
ncbi:hypothetical protein JSE7799_00103 [Jannaschia seosinensis]|uniref:Uncharacterized protein n=1 Tax=Jannaschia seosinensis TaxID=313367 RepID=A0A0M7B6G9_9RHOB|nr:hypothetical protein [Jannaschia seosinensis]CUH09520.1 hypothetical protein JSE7799_00103 [Jannaschia seosinensis]